MASLRLLAVSRFGLSHDFSGDLMNLIVSHDLLRPGLLNGYEYVVAAASQEWELGDFDDCDWSFLVAMVSRKYGFPVAVSRDLIFLMNRQGLFSRSELEWVLDRACSGQPEDSSSSSDV